MRDAQADKEGILDLFESSPDGYCIVATDWRVTFINRAALAFTRLRREDVIGGTWWQLFPGDLGTEMESTFRVVMEQGSSRTLTITAAFRPDRMVRINVFKCGGGIALRFRDVTEEQALQTRHLKALAELEAIYKHAPIGLALLDPDLRCLKINDALAELDGISIEEHLGRTIEEVIPEMASAARPALLKALLQNQPVDVAEMSGVCRPGAARRTLHQHVSPILDSDGRAHALLVAVTDVTPLKNAEFDLKAALQRQELLYHEIVHRVANNFQLISSMLLLEARTAGQGAAKVILTTAHRVQAMGLIHRALYADQREIGTTELISYLRRLSEDIATTFAAPENQRLVKFSGEGEARMEPGCAIKIGIIVTELVTNAFKYAYRPDEPGIVQVKVTRPRAAQIVVSVSDEGKGLPPDFDIASRKGLGMTIAAAQAKQLGGKLRHLPRVRGAEFQLSINLQTATPQAGFGFTA